MRFVFALIKLETMLGQALLQRADQLRQMLRHMAGRGIHDVVMSPITRLIEAQLETRRADFQRGKSQRLKSGLLDIADEHQRVMQRLTAHGAPAAKVLQRFLPRVQLTTLRGGRPQCEKYFYE